VNYLYARAARRAAQHAISGFGDTAVTSLLGHAQQAATRTRPRTGGISRSRSRSTYVHPTWLLSSTRRAIALSPSLWKFVNSHFARRSRSGRGGGRINAPGAARRTLPSRSRSRSKSRSQSPSAGSRIASQLGRNQFQKDAARAAAQKGANAIIAKQKEMAKK
jgi:hypothetical protein